TFFVGMGFAAGWTPCIGPIFASILFLAASNPGQGIFYTGMYIVGFALPFLVLTFFLRSEERRVGQVFIYYYCLVTVVKICFCLLFFQAEDGIRDRNVTGVQTCALPIYFFRRYGIRRRMDAMYWSDIRFHFIFSRK